MMAAKAFLFITAMLVAGLAAVGCSKTDDEAAIRKLIDRAAELAEQHQIGDLMQLAADGFSAAPGSHDARSVRAILFGAFKHYGTFDIRFPRPSVEVETGADTARASIYFMIVSRDRAVPDLRELYENPQQWLDQASEKADLYQLKLNLSKANGNWRVDRAELSPFKGIGF